LLAKLDLHQITFFVILILTFGLLLTEWLRNDLVAILAVLALALTGVLSPSEALSGFSSEPAIIVVCVFIMSGAFQQTGLAETIGAWISKLAGKSYGRALSVIMLSVAGLSAFTHHVTTTAVMLPVALTLLIMNNRTAWVGDRLRASLALNLVLAAALGFFAFTAMREVMRLAG
jgi:di/tricarboxylate transporter